MNQDLWTAVDAYFNSLLVPSDPVLDKALQASNAAGLPAHNVSPNQGKFLQLLARLQRTSSILEIGTLGAYSTIWLARALPTDGRLVTLESDPKCASVARANIDYARLSHVVELREGLALDTLPQIVAEGRGPFDMIFIDADKKNNADYFLWSLKLSRPGTIIVVDNVVRHGTVIHAESDDPSVQGVRRLNALIAAEPRVSATAMQTVGSKGYDGFIMILVK